MERGTLWRRLAALKTFPHIHHIPRTHRIQTTTTLIPAIVIASMESPPTNTPTRSLAPPPPSLLSPSRCHLPLVPPHNQHHHRPPEETQHRVKAQRLKPPRQSFAEHQMARRILRSVLVDGAVHYYQSNGNRPVKSESSEHACDANFLRRLVTRVSHVLAVSHPTPDYGRFHVPVLISRILGIS
jgi:hypothetical protein